ncbi:MAG: allophanate hydrolase [Hydrogenophaga sp.]|uniref:allophanate hydrolase n=1 Tax=Hydrogenophaga sp. TaxID=1904254 RepID=UPI001D58F44F|nr:allophanate hydrolase [Hydrogenophaga sp.]MBX3609480.1 allophanate hydrolase [Hydrogenophaga sp.]
MVQAASDATPQAAWLHRPAQALAGHPDGPLAGLRFAVKDNIDVAGWPTTAACPAFEHTPGAHATVVQRLLDAGAELAGKTNLDQFACGLNGTRSPYGAVPNSFDPSLVSGGSSSGSAYVVAAGEVDFSLGTDTAGSGRVPAGLNNIVGLKPSRGLLSTRGVLPAAQSIDCVSIFARTVGVAARVLAQAMGHDPLDPYSRALTLAAPSLSGRFRFGVPDQLDACDAPSRAAFEQAVAQLQALGGTPVSFDYTPFAAAADLLYESALVAERYAAIRGFFDGHESEVIEPVRTIVGNGRNYSAADWCDAQVKLRAYGQQAQAAWAQMDVMVVPTAPAHIRIDAMRADPVAQNRRLGAYTNFVNLLDYAALSVPTSLREDGLPFGVTLIAPAGMDLALLDLGQRVHHASGLTLGATGAPLPTPEPLPAMGEPTVDVAVVGAHLSGMPLNSQLTERGATLVRSGFTSDAYRLFALPGTTPPKPGLLRVGRGLGQPIAIEIWRMPLRHYGSFVALIPAPLGIGSLELADGQRVQGFSCEHEATLSARDITDFGGWRAYMAQNKPATA